MILQTFWKFHVVSSGFPDSRGVCVAGGLLHFLEHFKPNISFFGAKR